MSDEKENIVAAVFDDYSENQKEIFEIEKKKVRNKVITLAILIFAMDLLALFIGNSVNGTNLLIISVIPAGFIGLAFLALKEPMVAMIIATIILLGAWTYSIFVLGARGAMMGWLTKAIAIYLLLAGFQSAREAQRIKKELRL